MAEIEAKRKLAELDAKLRDGAEIESKLMRCWRREKPGEMRDRMKTKLDKISAGLDATEREIRKLKRKYRFELLPVASVKSYKAVVAKPPVNLMGIEIEKERAIAA